MKLKSISLSIAALVSAAVLGSCAAAVPSELVGAREAYRRASFGIAAEVAPAELHVAKTALNKAEKSFDEEEDSFRTKDLAYVAQRKAELAQAIASITVEQGNQSAAKDDYVKTQGVIVDKTKANLDKTRTALAESELTVQLTAEQLAAEQKARLEAEKRAAAALANLAAVKDEPRGMVITLSGSVLFTSAKWTLSADAQTRLRSVAEVLLETPDRKLLVEGHTDSQGSDGDNLQLSQNRADAVRNFLVQQGYDASRVQALGMGEGSPVGENESTEGRANNRRVEIIIQREVATR